LNQGWAPWNNVTGGYNPAANLSAVDGTWFHRTTMDRASLEVFFNGGMTFISSLSLIYTDLN
jgi:hypothetical protein